KKEKKNSPPPISKIKTKNKHYLFFPINISDNFKE
ncbi:hypothetical protein, partial [Plasmodium yoelii yoelii]